MIVDEDAYLEHYGTPRHSGRYPWGSGGEDGGRRSASFLDTVEDLKRQGLSDKEIYEGMGISSTEYRARKSIAKNERKQDQINQAQRLKEKGLSNTEIGKRMGLNESSVRALLAPGVKAKTDVLTSTADMIQRHVDKKGFVDVGAGVHHDLNISSGMLNNAVAVLKEKGYRVHNVQVPQLGTGKNTTVKVLTKPGTEWGEAQRNRDKIEQVKSFTEDGGRTWLGLHPPMSIDQKRVAIRYAEDGGAEADGVLFVRRGVPDISLGRSNYAQVRVQVGDGHYMKGMAMYKDDLPDGVDIVYNTPKSKNDPDIGTDKLAVMKPLKRRKDTGEVDADNPFGANIKRQIIELDANGNEKLTSAMNIVNEENDWSKWSKNLSSQMLSKQSPTLARAQLDKTHQQRQQEFERISSLTHPTVRKVLLEKFGDETDSAAVHLQAAAIPRTHGHHVILPVSSMKPTEVYAPNYRHGERVVLIRHPHGGTFEIPELTVNNNHREARKLIGKDAKDAIGIHHSVAERLSGADFDGDTVLVIPNNNNSRRVKTTAALEGLKGFDPKTAYPKYPGMVPMSPGNKQTEMGKITNLITDMTIQGASTSELARAVRHSMVVIDAEKHELNYKASARDNGIAALKEKYQGKKNAGSATLISRAGAEARIPHREPRKASRGGSIDPATGKRVFEETGKPHITKVERLAITDDARTLLSGRFPMGDSRNKGTPSPPLAKR